VSEPITMSTRTHKNANKGKNKGFAQKRTMNPASARMNVPSHNATAAKFQQHDRRMGSFAQTGEHARTGNRGHQ
jgi:hypothetical protein